MSLLAKVKKIRGTFKEEAKYRIIVDRIDHGISSLRSGVVYIVNLSLSGLYIGRYLSTAIYYLRGRMAGTS